jgi:hypothetical protein
MHRDLLPVEVLPVVVDLGIDHGEEQQRAHPVEHADRRVGVLDEGVGRADADIGLAAHHGLGRDVLGIEERDLDRHPALLGALDGDQQIEAFDAGDVAESDPDGLLRLRRRRHEHSRRHGHGHGGHKHASGQSEHRKPSL